MRRIRSVWGLALLFALLFVLTANTVFAATGNPSFYPSTQIFGLNITWHPYPLSSYTWDTDYTAFKASWFGIPAPVHPMSYVVNALANGMFDLTKLFTRWAVTLIVMTFHMNILNYMVGALAGLLVDLRQSIFFPFLPLVVLGLALWSLWHGLVKGNTSRTFGGVLMSFAILVGAMVFMGNTQTIVAGVGSFSDRISQTLLGTMAGGPLATAQNPYESKVAQELPANPTSVQYANAALSAASGNLFQTLVEDPWRYGEYGAYSLSQLSGAVPTHGITDQILGMPYGSKQRFQYVYGLGNVISGRAVVQELRNAAGDSLLLGPLFGLLGNAALNAIAAYYKAHELSDPFGPAVAWHRVEVALFSAVAAFCALAVTASMALVVFGAQVLGAGLVAASPLVLLVAVMPGVGHDLLVKYLRGVGGVFAIKILYAGLFGFILVLVTYLMTLASAFPGISSDGSVVLPGQTPLQGTSGSLPLALVEVMVAVAFLLFFWLQKSLRQHVFQAVKLNDPLATARRTMGEVAAAGLNVAAMVHPAARALKVGTALAGGAGRTGAKVAGHITGKPLTAEQRLEKLADDGLMEQLAHDEMVAKRTGRKSELLMEAEARRAERLGPISQERIRSARENIKRTARAENVTFEDAARLMGLVKEKRREAGAEVGRGLRKQAGQGGRERPRGPKRDQRQNTASSNVEETGAPEADSFVSGTAEDGVWVSGPGGTVFRKFSRAGGGKQYVVRSVRVPGSQQADDHWEERVADMRASEARQARANASGNPIPPPRAQGMNRSTQEAGRRLWQKTMFARTGTGRMWRRAARLAERIKDSRSGSPEELLRRVSRQDGQDD